VDHRDTGRLLLIKGHWVVLAFCMVACASNDQSTKFVTLRELDATEQPTTSALGVLVAVATGGGTAVRVDVTGGTLDDTSRASLCFAFPTSSVNVSVLSIHPNDSSEALVTAVLGNTVQQDAGPADTGDGGLAETMAAVADGNGNATTELSIPCTTFRSLGVYSAIVASLGRAAVGRPSNQMDAGPPEDSMPADAAAPPDATTAAESPGNSNDASTKPDTSAPPDADDVQ
jgi:hypothetical protein